MKTKENSVYGPKFEPGTSQIRQNNAKHCTRLFSILCGRESEFPDFEITVLCK
jgi:hypothetical protein